jgi:acetate kinase
MKILVLNAGSNTLKYQLFDWESHTVIARGNAEKIGIGGSFIKNKDQAGNKSEFPGDLANHSEALKKILDILVQPEL